MKILLIPLLIGITTLRISAEPPPEFPTPEIRAAIQTQVFTPLKNRIRPMDTFSRVPLAMVSEEVVHWTPEVDRQLRGFEIKRSPGYSLLGLVSLDTKEVWLLDPATRKYVPAAEHPAIRVVP